MAQSTLRRWLLITAGTLSVGLGIAGIFLPLLPTTPFLLLAAACFLRSSDRLYRWLIHNRWFGPYIRNYREHRAIPLRAKGIALILLWTTVAYSAFALVSHPFLRILLLLIAAAVTAYLLSLKTPAKEEKKPEAG